MTVSNFKENPNSDAKTVDTGTKKQNTSSDELSNSSVEAPVPRSASPSEITDDEEEEDGEDDEEDMPLTPPTSEDKGPIASKPAASKPASKSTKQPKKVEVPTKAGVVKGQKGEGAKVKAKNDSGKGAKDVKTASEPTGKAGNQKSAAAQEDAAKETSCTNINVGSAVRMDPAVFATQIFDIFVGTGKKHFMAHEAILTQSPLLARLIQGQANKKGKQKSTLVLPRESPVNFGTLLEYLYSHQLIMPSLTGEGDLNSATDGEEAKTAAKGLAKLFVLAHNYEMKGMELRITHVLESTGLMQKIPGLEFFELAERLYPEDVDNVEEDVFAKHFAEVAPDLIRTVPDKDLPELMRMVSAGGTFAEAIFLAYNTAVKNGVGFGMGAGVQIKQEVWDEGEAEERPRKRAKTESGIDGADDGEGI